MKEHVQVPTKMALRAWKVSDANDCRQSRAESCTHNEWTCHSLDE